MRTPNVRTARNVAAGGLATALLVGTFLTPAGAHYAGQTDGHVFNTHVKSLADARYDRLRVGGHIRNTYLTNDTAQVFSNTSASPFALGGFSFNVPAGQTWRTIAEFTAESVCYGSGGYCIVDVVVDGGSILPVPNSGIDAAFDSTEGGTGTSSRWKGASLRRVVEGLAPGPHTIDFVAYVTSASATFRLDDYVASIDHYRA